MTDTPNILWPASHECGINQYRRRNYVFNSGPSMLGTDYHVSVLKAMSHHRTGQLESGTMHDHRRSYGFVSTLAEALRIALDPGSAVCWKQNLWCRCVVYCPRCLCTDRIPPDLYTTLTEDCRCRTPPLSSGFSHFLVKIRPQVPENSLRGQPALQS
jgi:hypothetical protein